MPARPIVQKLTKVIVRDTAVSPFLEEFDRRRRRGIGQYITWDQLRNRRGSSLQTLFQERFRGIKAIPMPGGGYKFVSTRGPNKISGGECAVATYYNGVRAADIGYMELLGGIEYYSPGYAPIQYRDSNEGTACGVVLFWPSP